MESIEQLREALASLRQTQATLQERNDQNQQLLDALASLLLPDDQDDAFERVFEALSKVFPFSQVMLLMEPEVAEAATRPTLSCIVARPSSLRGSRWTASRLFDKVLSGRVVATFSNVGVAEWADVEHAEICAEQPALYVPIGVRDRRGILVLLQSTEEEGFDRQQIEKAQRCSVLVSHALATHLASETAAESDRLRELTERLTQSEQLARRNASLMKEMVNVLPVGVAVHDASGRVVLANDAIAPLFPHPTETASGLAVSSDDDVKPACEARNDTQPAMIETQRSACGEPRTHETRLCLGEEEHTWLITEKSVLIQQESLLLTASLDITERKYYEEALAYRANHDPLTGLPNREMMRERVEQVIERDSGTQRFALVFLDLDHFKQINDFYSHAIGDGLLRALAARVGELTRDGDTLARISGDEFLWLVDPLESVDALIVMIDRVVESLKQPFQVEGHELMISASLGASIYPEHGSDYESLRRSADSAMYRSKTHRKGGVTFFDESMRHALTARMALEQQLRLAIREQHFRVALQAKVDIDRGCVVGFEALIRWVEPDGTIHMPGRFIELAGELGLLDDIARLALRDVLQQLPQLRDHFGNDVTVSLNVAADQAGDLAFMDAFIEELAASGQAPSIVLELTEDALVATQRFQDRVLPRLRALGVSVSIDDFGTGYSSLSTLADIIADEVKVDRAFITAIHERERSQGILKAIESLCMALGIQMVAEGVETEDELRYLSRHSMIRLVQGYLFSRPLFIEDLLASNLAGDCRQRSSG